MKKRKKMTAKIIQKNKTNRELKKKKKAREGEEGPRKV